MESIGNRNQGAAPAKKPRGPGRSPELSNKEQLKVWHVFLGSSAYVRSRNDLYAKDWIHTQCRQRGEVDVAGTILYLKILR